MYFSACLLVDNKKILLKKDTTDLPTTNINEGETTEKAAVRIAKDVGIEAEVDRFFALEFFSGKQVYTYLCKIKNIGGIDGDYSWYSIDEIKNKNISENLSAIIDKIKVIL